MKCPLPNKLRMSTEQKQQEMQSRRSFLDFLKGLFRINPFERWTARQAATHPFIAGTPYTGPFSPLVDPKSNERKLAYLVHTQCTQGNITHAQAIGLGLSQASNSGVDRGPVATPFAVSTSQQGANGDFDGRNTYYIYLFCFLMK